MAGAALVAGGTGALGRAVVAELLERGFDVAVPWIVEREREQLERDWVGEERLSLAEADLLDGDSAAAVVTGVAELEAVVNLVGGFTMGPQFHETPPEDFDRMIELNLKPAVNLARAAMPRLVEAGGGTFVGVSARAALEPFAGAAGYITGKGALLAFVQALAADYRDAGIRANAVLPSVIDTPANREAMPKAEHSKWVQPEEIARVIAFLVSEDSKVTSGAAVPVYGRA